MGPAGSTIPESTSRMFSSAAMNKDPHDECTLETSGVDLDTDGLEGLGFDILVA